MCRDRARARRLRAQRRARACALAYTCGLIALLVAQLLSSHRSGLLAFTAAIAPYLSLPCLLLFPLLPRSTILLRGAVVMSLVIGMRLAPRTLFATPPVPASATTLTVLTWNVASYQRDRRPLRRFIESIPADIVALEEDYTSWWDEDPAVWHEQEAALARAYPFQIRYPHGSPPGLTILSRYPIIDRSPIEIMEATAAPPFTWGRFDLGQGRTVVVVAAHAANPLRGQCQLRGLCYDTRQRDSDIAAVRSAIAPVLQRGEPLVLLGDFNLTDREPAYRDLTAGLWDAQIAVGGGLGHTWGVLSPVGGPLLRLDYLLGSAAIVPLRLQIDCTPRGSDHCSLRGQLALP